MLSVSGPTLVILVIVAVFIPTDYWDYSHKILSSVAKMFHVIPIQSKNNFLQGPYICQFFKSETINSIISVYMSICYVTDYEKSMEV